MRYLLAKTTNRLIRWSGERCGEVWCEVWGGVGCGVSIKKHKSTATLSDTVLTKWV